MPDSGEPRYRAIPAPFPECGKYTSRSAPCTTLPTPGVENGVDIVERGKDMLSRVPAATGFNIDLPAL